MAKDMPGTGGNSPTKVLPKKTDEEFLERFNVKTDVPVGTKNGTPMYTEEDVQNTPHALTRILRMIFVNNHITPEYFSEKFKEYAITTLGLLPSETNTPKGNLLKCLKSQRITNRKFLEVLDVFGYDILSITFELKDQEGSVTKYKY